MPKKSEQNEERPSQAEMVVEAYNKADNKDLFIFKPRKGDSYPLLSRWEVGALVYVVTGVFSDGSIQLARAA